MVSYFYWTLRQLSFSVLKCCAINECFGFLLLHNEILNQIFFIIIIIIIIIIILLSGHHFTDYLARLTNCLGLIYKSSDGVWTVSLMALCTNSASVCMYQILSIQCKQIKNLDKCNIINTFIIIRGTGHALLSLSWVSSSFVSGLWFYICFQYLLKIRHLNWLLVYICIWIVAIGKFAISLLY